MANAFRYFFGALCTRGQSSPGSLGPELVVPDFEDPATHPEWGKMLRQLPESAALWDAYGLRNGPLTR